MLFRSALVPPVTAPTFMIAAEPEPVSSVEAAVNVIAPRSIRVLVVITEPATFTVPGLVPLPVVARPPVKVTLSLAPLPSVTVPVFRKLVSPAMTFVPPRIDTLYPSFAVVNAEVSVRLSLNAIVAVLAVNTAVAAATVPVNVVAPLSRTVSVVTPVTDVTVITADASVPESSVKALLAPVTAPTFMIAAEPEPVSSVEAAVNVIAPRSIRVLVVITEPATFPVLFYGFLSRYGNLHS